MTKSIREAKTEISGYTPTRAYMENAEGNELNRSLKESTTMRKANLFFGAAATVFLLAAPLAFAQGGNLPASAKESGSTSDHGMAAGEQTSKPQGTAGTLVGTWTLVSRRPIRETRRRSHSAPIR